MQTISHYELLDRLGEGGMGVVYKARDCRLGRLVALKLLPPRLMESAPARRRFEEEARAIAALNHPRIATIYEVIEDVAGLVLEYLPGGALRERIGGEALPLSCIVDWGLQIAEGLAHAHRQGILHRDVKPENLMLTADGSIKITDFGLARLEDRLTVTMEGSLCGTLAYLAPECVEGSQPDRRSDVFSLGAVLYEMGTGQPPFAGDNAAALLYAIAHRAPAPPRELRPDLPELFEAVVLRALAKRREERYQSADELAEDLRAVREGAAAKPKDTQARKPVAKILVVEDEEDLRRGIEINLVREGFEVVAAATGRDGARIAVAEQPDLVLLDVMLPELNGLDVCRELRRNGFRAPILMLSARSEEIDRVVGLEIGADDYVTKPFSMRELLARVRAHLRASAANAG